MKKDTKATKNFYLPIKVRGLGLTMVKIAVAEEQKIVVASTNNAEFLRSRKHSFKAYARCSKEDTFDRKTGINLAIARLMLMMYRAWTKEVTRMVGQKTMEFYSALKKTYHRTGLYELVIEQGITPEIKVVKTKTVPQSTKEDI